MLTVLRRGPTSVAKPLISVSAISACSRSSRAHRAPHFTPSTSTTVPLLRRCISSSPWHQRAAEAVALQEEETEAGLEPELHAQKQNNQAVNYGPVTRFEELGDRNLVCKTVVDTLTQGMGMENMTQVQSMTINESLKGNDILAQARTGTGKTLAFLIPTLQNIINCDPSLERRGRRGSSTDIRAIIISPTRELAEQIAVEAKKLTRNTGVTVQTAVGGSSKSAGLRAIKMQGCHILVGTPGRLNDLLSDPYSQVRAPNLSALVLDEADRLLDQGFAPEIQSIQDLLPKRRDVDRQTLLYSATIPREVMQIVRKTMKPDFKTVRTVQEGEDQTHERVTQKLVNVGGAENLMPALVELCQRELANDAGRPFKAIVYFNATAEVSLAAAIMRNLKTPGTSTFHEHPLAPARIIEMHAKLSQEQRTRAADAFRKATSGIMLSSDVTARGMDFPNVTHVLQIGLPNSEEQYVHRLGRTARAGQEGEGWLFINNLETREVRFRLRQMALQADQTLDTAKVDMTREAQLPEHAAKTLTQVGEATRMVPRGLKVASYLANLGMYSWVPNKQAMVDTMNNRARYGWGMEKPPSVNPRLVEKLALKRVAGLQVGFEEREPRDDRDGYSGGGRSFGGSRGGGGSGRGYGSGFAPTRGGGSFGGGRGRGGSGGDHGSRPSYGGEGGERGGYSRTGGFGGREGNSEGGGYGRRDYGDRQGGRGGGGAGGYSRPPGRLPRGDMGEVRDRPRY